MRLVFLLWLLFVAVYDFRQRRVPNWLVLAGAALALAALALQMQPFDIGWTTAFTGAAVAFGGLLLLYIVGFMGAGDVKFAAALGLWVGLAALVPIWIVGSILAGVHSTLFLALQRWPVFPGLFQMLVGRNAAIDNTPNNGDAAPRRRRLVVPYAAYLALATAAWMVWGRQS